MWGVVCRQAEPAVVDRWGGIAGSTRYAVEQRVADHEPQVDLPLDRRRRRDRSSPTHNAHDAWLSDGEFERAAAEVKAIASEAVPVLA